jgi:hypothetical protein
MPLVGTALIPVFPESILSAMSRRGVVYRSRMNSGWLVALPLLVAIHLGLAHAERLEGDPGNVHETGSQHHSQAASPIEPEDPAASDDTCPIPEVHARTDPDPDMVPPLALPVMDAPVAMPILSRPTEYAPPRLDGPDRQAVLQRFTL